jgi:tight adherence protein B
VSTAVVLAGLAGTCAVLAAWEAIGAVDEQRVVRSLRAWLAPALEAVRSGREPTDPERRRLAALGALSLLGGGWLVAGPWAGIALGAAAPWAARAVLRSRRRRRASAIAAGVPAIARALGDALAGGQSVRGAVAAAAHDGGVTGAAGEELRIAADGLVFGERTEDVLLALARRAGGGPLDTLVAAVLLQREAGGDLPALLRDLAVALEERTRVLADARSATAQARFTALLVVALPAVGLVLGELAQPGLVLGLASSPLTAAMVVLALVLQAVAFGCVRRIARIGAAA